jgi:hypothetical protein
MNLRRLSILALSISVFVPSSGLDAQAPPVDIEIGYRWLSTSGNEDMYRTQINEQSGFLLRAFTLVTQELDEGAVIDHLRIDASELGTGPAGSLRLQTGRSDLYRLRLGYRTADAFSALPAFANPLLDQGIIPGQHTFDRTRESLDIELELLPSQRIVPFIAYSRNQYDGPGTTTYALGGDEFLLLSDLDETEQEIRLGAAFHFGMVSGQITQGWRDFRGREHLVLAAGAGGGNNPGAILGRPISADQLTRDSRTEVDTPFTSFYVTAQPIDRLRLVGSWDRFTADTDGFDRETASGSFLSFRIGRFFDGFNQDVSLNARNRSWRGIARAEYSVSRRIDVFAGFRTQQRELDGSSLINTLFSQTLTFGGVDPRDVETILNTDNSLERSEDVFNLGVAGRAFGPFSFRAEYRESRQDVVLDPDLAQIVVPGAQGGEFDRDIRTFDLSGNYAAGQLMLGAAWRRDRADDPIFRTDFLDRDRIRLRAGWRTPENFFRAAMTVEETTQENDRPGIGFDSTIRQFSGNVEVMPIAALRIRASYSKFDADSIITIRRPENFNLEPSIYTQSGDAIDAGFSLLLSRVLVDASLGRIENKGDIPFSIDRHYLRVGYDFTPAVGVAAEWANDDYDERLLPVANYDADRFGLFLRWRGGL